MEKVKVLFVNAAKLLFATIWLTLIVGLIMAVYTAG